MNIIFISSFRKLRIVLPKVRYCAALPWRGCTWDRIPASPPHFHTWGPDAGTRTLENNNPPFIRSLLWPVLWIRIQHYWSMRIRIGGYDDQNLKEVRQKNFFWQKIAIYLSYASIKGVQATEEVFTLKREHPASQNFEFLHFCGYPDFCTPGSGSAFPTLLRIQIQPTKMNADLDTGYDECINSTYLHSENFYPLYFIARNISDHLKYTSIYNRKAALTPSL